MRTACRKTLLILALAALALPLAAQAKRKPWTAWTLKDATDILTNSAWGQIQNDTDTSSMMFEAGKSGLHQAVTVRIRMCFLSAKPVRQAFARIAELDRGALNSERQIQAARDFITAKFEDTIVIAAEPGKFRHVGKVTTPERIAERP